MPVVLNISRQRPLGLLAGVVLFLLTLAALVSGEDWFSAGPASFNAAGSFDAEGLLLTATYKDDPVAIRQVISSFGMILPSDAANLALITAVTQGHGKAVAELLRCGAAVEHRTLQGRTPLLLAAGTPGDDAIADLLLNAGADPNAISNLGETPAGEAAKIGDRALVKLLLSHGAESRTVGSID